MRTLLLLTVLAVLAAGCTSNSGNTTTPTPTTATMPTTGGNGSASATVLKTDEHTFTDNPATGAAPVTFTVPSTMTTITLNVSFAPASGAPAGVASGIQVKVGGAVCTLTDGPVTGATSCAKSTPAAGVKQIEYSGSGPVTAHVVVSGT